MRVIGLTGGIASGKSTVSAMLRELGAVILDADSIYHELIAPQGGRATPLAAAIAARFPGVVDPAGVVDRGVLAAEVFGVPQALADLGAITHPAVAAELAHRVASLAAQGVPELIYDVPLLFERGLQAGMAAVIVVWVDGAEQCRRLMARDGLSEEAARRRMAAQMSLDEKRDRADHVIDNRGSVAQTRAQVEELWRALHADASGAG